VSTHREAALLPSEGVLPHGDEDDASSSTAHGRPRVEGPFLVAGGRKLTVKGVTYGTFAAGEDGELFPPRARVRLDLAAMRAAQVDAIRTYTPPPDWLLEEARQAGMRVLVGIHWEGRNCNFDDPGSLEQAAAEVRRVVERCRSSPDVVLAYVIGNEVPPLVVRFYGWRVITRFLRRLYEVAKEADPGGLVTYGNYPSTEFLELDFLDFHLVNVYLLERRKLSAYLDRLLILTKGKPLLLGEIGDDSLRTGQEHQAEILDWTIPLALDKGACGLFVFSWTDDWHVGGRRIDDWAFGIVDRERAPKLALEVVRRRFGESPFDRRERPWPRVSVVVCNYNGGKTLDETLTSLERLDYPDYEILYVDDGSTDDSLSIARRQGARVRILAQENCGLSVARNVGAEAATGEIVAYIDSDAFADPDWLRYLVLAMDAGPFGCVGGPNLTPASDGLAAQFLAVCPGNPTVVLKNNVEAEHVAGVNMAIRRDVLLQIGGFDPIHRRAGDDVDLCWRLEDAAIRVGFAPAAIVWHHRRTSLARYLKQQAGYGEAEHQLERKHPERFNLCGYIRWSGRIYLAYRRASALFRPFVYHGHFGTGLFQTLYQKEPSYLTDGPTTIQWYLAALGLVVLGPISLWGPVVGGAMLALSLWCAFVAGLTTEVPVRLGSWRTIQKTATVTLLHLLFPVARWYGRIAARFRGSTESRPRREWMPLRVLCGEAATMLRWGKQHRRYWGPGGTEREGVLRAIHQELKLRRTSVSFGRGWENYDLRVNGSLTAEGRLFSSPEHYDQALCIGFRACTSRVAKWALALLTSGCIWAGLHDVRFLGLSVVPALLLWWLLNERARLRLRSWEAVEAAMAARGAKRFGDEATASAPDAGPVDATARIPARRARWILAGRDAATAD